MVYLKLGQYHKTAKIADFALQIDPDNVKALFRRGTAYHEMQEYELAVKDLNKLLTVEPNNSAGRNQLAKAKAKLKVQLDQQKALYKTMLSGLGKSGASAQDEPSDIWKDLEDENKREFKISDVEDQLKSTS